MEIAYLMPNERAVEGAIKFAERQRHRSLAQKLSEIAQQKLEKLNDEFNDELNDEECEQIDQTTNNRFTISTLKSLISMFLNYLIKNQCKSQSNNSVNILYTE